jgi:hypothetical protein
MEAPPHFTIIFMLSNFYFCSIFIFFCLATVALCAVLADGGSSTVFTVAFLPKVFADARPGFRFVYVCVCMRARANVSHGSEPNAV